MHSKSRTTALAQPLFRHAGRWLLATAVAVSAHATALADTFPDKPVRMVVPFSAGGTMDTFGRLVAGEMAKALGTSVVIENLTGAGGSIGSNNVARSAADGYSFCFCATGSTVILPLMDNKLPYKVPQDLLPVAHVLRIEQTIVVNADKGAASLAALVEQARTKPTGLLYGTPGIGTSNHLAGELFKQASGTNIEPLHYKGEAPALVDLLSGQIDFMIASVSFAEPHVKAGKMRVLALTGPNRLPNYPAIATIAESGFPGYEATTQVGLHVPKGTPRERIDKLNAALNQALQSKELRERMAANGVTPVGGTPEAYAQFLTQEYEKWGHVIKQAGIKLQ
ncbi:Bug family tripartite tricarboxylate transporter substrate binding protein [Hydrogenophaga sp. NFH-34]|uniref:Bug family tripartite tricarboxylate transporter substrate binding protein n=1 Tax=Hydrogenophaga sp. NFH-34 TaxID=2744446 RepID=UPI001F3F1189|nr:tripartite tricarboxylate transporter substrate binding protein [Hydrogenophaga sp. NFH-34]